MANEPDRWAAYGVHIGVFAEVSNRLNAIRPTSAQSVHLRNTELDQFVF